LTQTERFCRLSIGRADFLHFIKECPHTFGQPIHSAFTADVHEVNLRFVEKEVIMQCGYFQTLAQGHAHDRVHFILEENHVAHHPNLRSWGEGRP